MAELTITTDARPPREALSETLFRARMMHELLLDRLEHHFAVRRDFCGLPDTYHLSEGDLERLLFTAYETMSHLDTLAAAEKAGRL